jgi:hypothetical protein
MNMKDDASTVQSRTPSNAEASPRPSLDFRAMIAIQIAQSLITAFVISSARESPVARLETPVNGTDPKVAVVCADAPTLISVYREWYGSRHLVTLSSSPSRA